MRIANRAVGIMWGALICALLQGGGAAAQFEVSVPGTFAGGEFQIVVNVQRGRYEVWSYDPEADQLEFVMTAPVSGPVPGSRTDCCVIESHDALYVGGIGRDVVRHKIGGWNPNAEIVGRSYGEWLRAIVGDPPRLLMMGERSYWTYISFLGDASRRELSKWWIDVRDPWTYAKLSGLSGSGGAAEDFPHWIHGRTLTVDDDLLLMLNAGASQFVSLTPLAPVGPSLPFQALVKGGYSVRLPVGFHDGAGGAIYRIVVDAEALTVDREEVDNIAERTPNNSEQTWPRLCCRQWRNGIYFVPEGDDGPIRATSAPGREPAVDTSFNIGRAHFLVHDTGAYVLAYDSHDGTDAVDVWALMPEGTFVKTRTLDMDEAVRARREGE